MGHRVARGHDDHPNQVGVTNGGVADRGGPGVLRVEVIGGKATGESIIVEDRLVIGRNSDGHGRLADDPELSRHHAEIARTPSGEFAITDLSSTNGTVVNGTRLTAPALLGIGDQIEVGTSRLVVRSVPVIAAPAPPDVDVRAVTVVGEVSPVNVAAPEPAEPETEPHPAAGDPPLLLRLTVDFEQESAQLSVEGTGEPIRLVLDHGRWRVGDGVS